VKILDLTLVAQEPLVITDGSAESMAHQSLGYIPGNMLLGALASRWVKLNPGRVPDDDAEFRSLFLENDVLWGHATPLVGDEATVPLPFSFQRIKNHKGLPVDGESGENCFVMNMLRMEEGDELQKLLPSNIVKGDENPKCKKLPESFIHPATLRMPQERRVWNIHVALGNQRSSLEGQLFGFSAIAPQSRFFSRVFCKSDDALRRLFEGLDSIRVGHARSAGYGLVTVSTSWHNHESFPNRKGKEFVLYLRSHYLPTPSWLHPLESLVKELEGLTGAKPVLEKTFSNFMDIQGFNSHWKRPRSTRGALCQGSVIKVRFDADVTLPVHLLIGADQREGYGRVEVDPVFLSKFLPDIPCIRSGDHPPCEPPKEPAGIVWQLVRKRTARRQMEEMIWRVLSGKKWDKFFQSICDKSQPTPSQRGNIRILVTQREPKDWIACFENMLDKTPGQQWKQAVCDSPIKSRKEHLSDVMKDLLDPAWFRREFTRELASFREADINRAHTLFIYEMLSRWGKLFRIKSKGGKN